MMGRWLAALLVCTGFIPANAYEYCGGWGSANVVMNLYPKPVETFSAPAEYQLAEWDLVQGDTSRPFRKLTSPVDSLARGDGYNTAAFLDESTLRARYGLSFDGGVLAWASSRSSGGCTHFFESDVIFNADTSWTLWPGSPWFQAVALHEFGHVLGMRHYDGAFSIMNTYAWGEVGGETLYMDDREAFRSYYGRYWNIPQESDVAIYARYHDGSSPKWAPFPGDVVVAGSPIVLEGFTVENLGTETLAPVRVGFFLSTDTTITGSDVFLGGVSWSALERFSFGIAAATVTIPESTPPGQFYVGALADYDDQLTEANEGNNAVVLGRVSGTPTPIFVEAPPTTTTTSSTTTTHAPVPSTTTTTTPGTCGCPTGTHCASSRCEPDVVPIPKRKCKTACRPDVRACKAACDTRKCRMRCKRSVVGTCKRTGACGSGASLSIGASQTPALIRHVAMLRRALPVAVRGAAGPSPFRGTFADPRLRRT